MLHVVTLLLTAAVVSSLSATYLPLRATPVKSKSITFPVTPNEVSVITRSLAGLIPPTDVPATVIVSSLV